MRTITRWMALGVLVAAVTMPFTPAASLLASRLAVAPVLTPAQAIVVLGGGLQNGTHMSEASVRRTVTGVRLYHRDLAPVLLFSGGAGEQSAAEGDVMASAARELGVPPDRILVETVSTNTRSQALEVARVLHAENNRRILLVTDPFHMARARAVFEQAGFEVLPAPADPWTGAPQRPEGNLWLMRSLAQEILARVYYRARGWL